MRVISNVLCSRNLSKTAKFIYMLLFEAESNKTNVPSREELSLLLSKSTNSIDRGFQTLKNLNVIKEIQDSNVSFALNNDFKMLSLSPVAKTWVEGSSIDV